MNVERFNVERVAWVASFSCRILRRTSDFWAFATLFLKFSKVFLLSLATGPRRKMRDGWFHVVRRNALIPAPSATKACPHYHVAARHNSITWMHCVTNIKSKRSVRWWTAKVNDAIGFSTKSHRARPISEKFCYRAKLLTYSQETNSQMRRAD